MLKSSLAPYANLNPAPRPGFPVSLHLTTPAARSMCRTFGGAHRHRARRPGADRQFRLFRAGAVLVAGLLCNDRERRRAGVRHRAQAWLRAARAVAAEQPG